MLHFRISCYVWYYMMSSGKPESGKWMVRIEYRIFEQIRTKFCAVQPLESGISKLVPGHFSSFEAGGRFLKQAEMKVVVALERDLDEHFT